MWRKIPNSPRNSLGEEIIAFVERTCPGRRGTEVRKEGVVERWCCRKRLCRLRYAVETRNTLVAFLVTF